MKLSNGLTKVKINQTFALAKKGWPDFSRIATVTFLAFGIIMNCNNIWAESGQITKLEGFGGYKFGMTLEEADAVRKDDVINRACEFHETEVCIERRTVFFGEEAIITAQISSRTHRLDQVIITFNRIKSTIAGACKKVLHNIAGPLLKTYGTGAKEENNNFVWHLPQGGEVTLTRLCITEDSGVVVVSYRQTDAF